MTTYTIKTADKRYDVAAKTRDEAIAKATAMGIKAPYTVERGKG